jgi:hypothetical protein
MLVHDPYYDIKAVSNSSLRYINPAQGGSPAQFKAHWDGKSESLKTSSLEFGNLVHLAVLEPHLLNYQVDKTNTPDRVRDVVKHVFENVKPVEDPFDLGLADSQPIGTLKDNQMAVMSALDATDFNKHWRAETRLKKIFEDGEAYFQLLQVAAKNDEFVITEAQATRLDRVLAGLSRDALGSHVIYMADTDAEQQDVEYLNEQEVTWEEEGYSFPLKGKIDRLRIDHANCEFTVIDLKTTSKLLGDFHESFANYHYARQMAAYEIAACKFIEQKFGKRYKPSHKHLILAVETKGEFRAAKFVVSEESMNAGRAEYKELLDRLQFHFTTNNWIDDREYIESGRYKL